MLDKSAKCVFALDDPGIHWKCKWPAESPAFLQQEGAACYFSNISSNTAFARSSPSSTTMASATEDRLSVDYIADWRSVIRHLIVDCLRKRRVAASRHPACACFAQPIQQATARACLSPRSPLPT